MAYRFKAYTGLAGSYGFPVAALATLANYPLTTNVKLGSPDHGSRSERVGSYVADIGDAVFPAAANVWHDTGLYGPTGADTTPVMQASDIPNCEAANIKR